MAPLCQHKMTLFSGSMQGFLFLYVSFILFSLQDSLLDEAGRAHYPSLSLSNTMLCTVAEVACLDSVVTSGAALFWP
jgi:hypothetical protein